MRRSSLELHSAVSTCFPDTVSGPYSSSFDQDALTSILLAATAQNGFVQQDAATAVLPHKPQLPYLANGTTTPVTAAGADGYDPSLMESEEPGPLPCLPRTRALGSGGPYGSSAAALMMQQQQQQGGYQGSNGRQGRPRRHSVTIGMLNEHQQQQQAAAYAAALAAAQQGGMSTAGMPAQAPGGPAGLGMLGQMQQVQQPPQGAASPAKQQLQALNNVQAMAAAAKLGMGASSLLASLGLQQQEQLQQQLAASSGMTAGLGEYDLGAQFSMNAPRMPNTGSCRRHSWAPTGVNGSTAYAQALLLQQQQQRELAAAAVMGDPRGLVGVNGMNGLNSMNGMSGMNGMNGMNGLGLKQKGLAGASRPPAGYTNGNGYLNGHGPSHNGPPSGGYVGLSAAAAAAAAMAQLTSLQSAGALAGLDPLSEQQFTRLLQLQQQSGLAGGQPMLDPYVEAVLEAGQALGQPNPALLPSLGPVAGTALAPVAAGLLPAAAAAATTALTQLGFDAEGLSPAAAAAAASMYAPLKINGVTLDSQLLVAPFADNWDVMCAQGGQAGVTPQQLAAVAAGLSAGHVGFGVMSPRTAGGAVNGTAGGAPVHGKHHKGLPTRSGSCGSNSSNGSNGHVNGSSGHLSSTPLSQLNGRTSTAAAGSGNGSAAAAALAAASKAAAMPPIANVCSDAPWDLKKAAEEDAKVLAAQQGRVQRLVAALEKSQTLAKVRAAQAAAGDAKASGDAAKEGQPGSERAQPVLFGYQLPDTGADAWGGSSSSAAIESTPGSGCISQEPSNKLFVGNIGWWVTEDDLLHWFSRFGNVVHVKVRCLCWLDSACNSGQLCLDSRPVSE